MLRRIGRDRRRRHQRRAGFSPHHRAARGEVLGVVGDGADVLIAARKISAHEPLGMGDRAFLPQLVPDRIRIFTPARIEMVEVRFPIGRRRPFAHRPLPSFLDDFNSKLRAIGLREPHLGFERWRHSSVAALAPVAEFVELEQFRRKRKAAGVALAALAIDFDFEDLVALIPMSSPNESSVKVPDDSKRPSSREPARRQRGGHPVKFCVGA